MGTPYDVAHLFRINDGLERRIEMLKLEIRRLQRVIEAAAEFQERRARVHCPECEAIRDAIEFIHRP